MKYEDSQLKSEMKGVWVPLCIWENHELSLQEKFILVKAESFKECFASNEYFSGFANVSVSRVKQILKSLEDKGYISRSVIRKNKVVVKRVISVDKIKFNGINVAEVIPKDQDIGQETVPSKDRKLSQVRLGNCPGSSKGINSGSSKDSLCASTPLSEAFDTFWNAGMRKINKKKAQALFNSIAKSRKGDPLDFANMLAEDIAKRVSSNQLGFGQMHPTTYLNGERWEDEISDDPVNHGLIDQDTDVPVDKIIDLYHRVCPNLPPVSVTTDPTLRSMIAERWNESPDQQSGDGFWVPFFIKANSRAQVFYRGQNIVPRLEALVSRAVFREIAEARS